ncbi:succinylglutamate desuccinylase/aspartoacylase family protein [Tenacibaculum sp. C7A-26P2]|uniref:succinylglutamate desuccinylase/aspartoacylase family protein n=1 Tax=Tenacibaculum sp. C7A-26P2 TaxID=3447504 RepID=UPI003F860811
MFSDACKNKEIKIRNERVQLGESKLIKIPIDRLATGTLIEIPVYVFNGDELGPTVLLQGGLHGDEINSIELVRRMLIDKRYKIYKGCVIVIPLLNVFGFLDLTRNMHGKDVNRSFPGSRSGSLASRIAFYLMKELVKNIDFAIDYHTGGAQRNNFPQIRYTPKDPQSLKLAKVFKAPLIFGSKLISKSFRNECYKNNIPVVVYEGGESLRLDERAIKEGIKGTLRVLNYFGMIDDNLAVESSRESIHLKKRKWVRAKVAGLFSSTIANGEFIEKGQVLGRIMDTYGETSYAVKAPISGYIIAKNNFPIINMGDALFHVGEI